MKSKTCGSLKITIATVTYNAAEVLERTLHSVENQTYPFIEHLIIDGNSTDGTLTLLHRYQERNTQNERPHEIGILSENDNGLYDAMNKALQMATGDYILFLNAGDKLHSNDTAAKVALAAGHDAAVVYGDTDIVDNAGHFLFKRRLIPPDRLSWKSFKWGMLVCHQAFFARMDIAKHQLYDLNYRFSADFDWCIRIMKQAALQRLPLVNVHTVVADYLDGGLTVKNHRKSLCERFHIMTHYYGLVTTVVLHIVFIFRQVARR